MFVVLNGRMSIPGHQRQLVLGGIALLLFVILVCRWVATWGLITLHVKEAPLAKVLASMARQGHVRIETSLDSSKPVSLDVDRVPVTEALDSLAARADASWCLAYLAAPTKPQLNGALISISSGGKVDGWTTYYYPMPFGMDDPELGVVDPRSCALAMEGPEKDFSKLMNEASQKSGIMTLFPKEWAPSIPQLPKPNQVHKVIPALVRSAHGKSIELFLLTDRRRRDRPPGEASPSLEKDVQEQPPMNTNWLEQRTLAKIAHLPPEKQSEAKQELTEHKAIFAEMRKLSPEERRAKMRAMMNNPDLVDKMADRRLVRDAKLSAEQRINRAVNYLNRKSSIQASQNAGKPQ